MPPQLLAGWLPSGLSLDLIDGQAFVSLVAFDFLDTKVFGLKWPGFVNFPELNLRFYVRCGNERGVVFIKEMVPQAVVAGLARLFYNEPYIACPMKSSVQQSADEVLVRHEINISGQKQSLKLKARNAPYLPPHTGIEHYFKEHQWGFGRDRQGRTIGYEVRHEFWEVYPVLSLELDFDFSLAYGQAFSGLGKTEPYSVILARGSQVEVYPQNSLRS